MFNSAGWLLLFVGGGLGLIVFVIWSSYNRLVTLRNRYQNAYSQVDVQLQRRYDLIPNLVKTAKGYMEHERETLQAVTEARNLAMSTSRQAAANPSDPQAIQQAAAAEAGLTGVLGRLMAVAESYPTLKADSTMLALMEELRTTENKISFARQSFNDSVTLYNTKREVFPSNIVAGAFNFSAGELWRELNPEARQAPQVSF